MLVVYDKDRCDRSSGDICNSICKLIRDSEITDAVVLVIGLEERRGCSSSEICNSIGKLMPSSLLSVLRIECCNPSSMRFDSMIVPMFFRNAMLCDRRRFLKLERVVQESQARLGKSENSLPLVNLNSKLTLKFESLLAVQCNAVVFE